MYAAKLLVLVLAVQQVIAAYQRTVAECANSRPKYRLQREWRSGTFRFESDQFVPTRWEWQRNRKLRTGTKRPRLAVTSRKRPAADAKLLWKEENRHEDYDSLMSSEDDGAVWPGQTVTAASVSTVGSHDNIGSRMVKMVSSALHSTFPPAAQFAGSALFSQENYTPESIKDADDSGVPLQLYEDVDHVCDVCGGIITTTESATVSIMTHLAESSNQILSIQPHPNAVPGAAYKSVPTNPEAYYGFIPDVPYMRRPPERSTAAKEQERMSPSLVYETDATTVLSAISDTTEGASTVIVTSHAFGDKRTSTTSSTSIHPTSSTTPYMHELNATTSHGKSSTEPSNDCTPPEQHYKETLRTTHSENITSEVDEDSTVSTTLSLSREVTSTPEGTVPHFAFVSQSFVKTTTEPPLEETSYVPESSTNNPILAVAESTLAHTDEEHSIAEDIEMDSVTVETKPVEATEPTLIESVASSTLLEFNPDTTDMLLPETLPQLPTMDLTVKRDSDDAYGEAQELLPADGFFKRLFHTIYTLLRSILDTIVYLFADASSS